MWKYVIASVALVLLLLTVPRPSAEPVIADAAPVQLDPSREQWAIKFLNRIGNADPTYETMAFVVAWQGGENTEAKFNPLATTQEMPGFTCFNVNGGFCVKNYPDEWTGIEASAITIANGRYPNMFYGLQNNQPELALNSDELKTWGTGLANVEAAYRKLVAAPVLPGWVPPADDVRNRVIQTALAQVGKPYVLGTRGPDTFDCSGFVQWVWGQNGVKLTNTTFTQQDDPNMRNVDPSQLNTGDAIYFQFPWDQHTGLLADVDGDGKWDMIHAATPDLGVIVDYDVFATPFWTNAIMGYRSAL
jgi:hypothetical protein